MSLDFTALAGSLAVGVPGVRVCLFVSGDGLALAAHPASEEAAALVAWARLNELGLMERGFVSMENENWIFSKGPEYSGLVITDSAVRPGILLDRLDQALELANESRSRQEGMSPVPGVVPPMAASAKEPSRPARKIRLPVHREAPRAVPQPELVEAERVPSRASRPAAAPPMPPEPPMESTPPRSRRDRVEEPEDRVPAPPTKQSKQSKSAPAEKKPARRRGLGNYVGKQPKAGRPSPNRREAVEEPDEWVEEPVERPRRKQRVQPPATRRPVEEPRDEIDDEEPEAFDEAPGEAHE